MQYSSLILIAAFAVTNVFTNEVISNAQVVNGIITPKISADGPIEESTGFTPSAATRKHDIEKRLSQRTHAREVVIEQEDNLAKFTIPEATSTEINSNIAARQNGPGNRPGEGPRNGPGNRPGEGSRNGPGNRPGEGSRNGPRFRRRNGPKNGPGNRPGNGPQNHPSHRS